MFDLDAPATRQARTPLAISDIDRALTAQIVVAWAGEGGEDRRLGWWRSDLISRFGGEDLFQRLLPNTWSWAVLQGAREAARRTDAALRRQDHDPDRIVSLYNLGFELDERLEERVQELKRSGETPAVALPGLNDAIEGKWDRDRFGDWLRGHGDAETTAVPLGRLIKGDRPASLDHLVRRLVAALLPLVDSYPLPHFRRSK